MSLPPQALCFDELAVAVPALIRHPILRKLTEQVQHSTLSAPVGTDMHEADFGAHRRRVLDRLYQTPIADASILVAITHEHHPKLLLTRRAAHMNSHAGEVSCAGGKHEVGDGSNVITALREAYEETALPADSVQLLGQLPIQTAKSGMSVRPIVALIAPDLILVPELGEISRIFWADFELLLTQPTVEYAITHRIQEQDTTILTPSWQVDGETVWGLTGRVIANLLEIGFNRQLTWYYRIQDTVSPK